jgi:hypothetical protein
MSSYRFGLKKLPERASISMGLKSKFGLTPRGTVAEEEGAAPAGPSIFSPEEIVVDLNPLFEGTEEYPVELHPASTPSKIVTLNGISASSAVLGQPSNVVVYPVESAFLRPVGLDWYYCYGQLSFPSYYAGYYWTIFIMEADKPPSLNPWLIQFARNGWAYPPVTDTITLDLDFVDAAGNHYHLPVTAKSGP